MIDYDGTTPLKSALEQLHSRKLSFDAMSKITAKYRERLNLPAGKPVKAPTDKLKIYQWECERAKLLNEQLPTIEIMELLPTEQPAEQLPTDTIQPTENKSLMNELNIIQWDKFISINYRHTDNSRHTVQIEQFYIYALNAIGITDIGAFVSECLNSATDKVTKRVKCGIVNQLLKARVQ
jgi:hypothetical protein